MKNTDKTKLVLGLKYLAGSLPLVIIGPSIIYSAFNNQEHPYFVLVLILGIFLMFSAIGLMFLGIRKTISALFD